jgi:hypothetical protein
MALDKTSMENAYQTRLREVRESLARGTRDVPTARTFLSARKESGR